jgi:hypothetical protein
MFESHFTDVCKDIVFCQPTPLLDIFYLLQTILPGILTISLNVVTSPDFEEQKIANAVPDCDWLETRKEFLKEVLGDTEKYDKILQAAWDYKSIIRKDDGDDEREPFNDSGDAESYDPGFSDVEFYDTESYNSDDDYYTTLWGTREPKDYTACSSHDCGFCGMCDY